jgi:hypothetical protein
LAVAKSTVTVCALVGVRVTVKTALTVVFDSVTVTLAMESDGRLAW